MGSLDWKKDIREAYQIEHISNEDLYKLFQDRRVLWTTRCSKAKKKKGGFPTELYESYVTRYFYRFVLSRELPFAIVSDKYGLHYSDEGLPFYDTHPSVLSTQDKWDLGKEIYRKAKSRGFNKIVFYNNSPLMSKPYLEMLSNAGIKIFFTTRLI